MTTTPYNKTQYYHKMNIKYRKKKPSIHLGGREPLFLTPPKLSAASLLAAHYHTEVFFLGLQHQFHTPDIVLFDTLWKIRNPIGGTIRTVERQVQRSLPHSGSIIFDARNMRLDNATIRQELEQLVKRRQGTIRHLILIEKGGTIIELR